jgi:hypothetical protein
MIQAQIVNKINFPKITLQSDLEYIANEIIIPDMQKRIKQRKAIDGGPLPENEPSTIARKGHSKQLQDTGTLLNSFEVYPQKDMVKITVGAQRHDIGTYLQGGIRTNIGIKAYRFFGISVFAERKLMAYMKKRLGELIHGRK